MTSTRRGALGALLALPVASLPAIAGTQTSLSEREAEFLALAPKILPLAVALNAASLEVHRLYEAAGEAAGPYPGRDNERAHRAWVELGRTGRDANGYHDAWAVMNAADNALTSLVDGFDTVEMATLPAILLKALLADLGEWWQESVVDDLQRYAEGQLCA